MGEGRVVRSRVGSRVVPTFTLLVMALALSCTGVGGAAAMSLDAAPAVRVAPGSGEPTDPPVDPPVDPPTETPTAPPVVVPPVVDPPPAPNPEPEPEPEFSDDDDNNDDNDEPAVAPAVTPSPTPTPTPTPTRTPTPTATATETAPAVYAPVNADRVDTLAIAVLVGSVVAALALGGIVVVNRIRPFGAPRRAIRAAELRRARGDMT